MKKFIAFTLFRIFYCNVVYGESYFFKKCKLSDLVFGDYTINIDKKIIDVNLKAADGKVQNFTDKIKIIEKDQIISAKIKSMLTKSIKAAAALAQKPPYSSPPCFGAALGKTGGACRGTTTTPGTSPRGIQSSSPSYQARSVSCNTPWARYCCTCSREYGPL